MASGLTLQKFRSNNKLEMWDHDPGGTAATLVSPDGGTTKRAFDMKDYEDFAFAAMSSTLTGNGITKLEIVAYTDSALTANATVVKDSAYFLVAWFGECPCTNPHMYGSSIG